MWKLLKQRNLALGDISQESCRYSIQDIVVIIPHGRETWLAQSGGGNMGVFNGDYVKNSLRSVPVVVNGGEED